MLVLSKLAVVCRMKLSEASYTISSNFNSSPVAKATTLCNSQSTVVCNAFFPIAYSPFFSFDREEQPVNLNNGKYRLQFFVITRLATCPEK